MIYIKENTVQKFIRLSKEVIFGSLAHILNLFVPAKAKSWVFGADYGFSYRENSKYLFQYMVAHQPEYDCTFVTGSKAVMDMLEERNLPCVMNDSLKGIWKIVRADAVFCSQNMNDIRYAFRKKNRTYYYMTHGQAYKNSLEAMPKKLIKETSFVQNLKNKTEAFFSCTYSIADSEFVPATSDFLAPHMALCIGHSVPVEVIGTPRNDSLLADNERYDQIWPKRFPGKKIITYMPTHRLYGKGEVSPTPFCSDEQVQHWLRENNVVLLVKQHPNMVRKLADTFSNDVIVDISKEKIDPQLLLKFTDVLISDYSSVFIDYLLLNRPVLFYIYDNYADVEGAMYDIKEDFPDNFCYNEEELFEKIKISIETPVVTAPSAETLSKYHKFIDAGSCERYFQTVIRGKYF